MRKAFLWLHRWLGLGAALVIAFLGVSGAALVFRPELDARFNPQLLQVEPGAKRASWQANLSAVKNRFPDAKVSFVFVGQSARDADEWWLDGGKTRVYQNPYNSQITGTRAQGGDFFTWLHDAHTHLFVGEIGEQIAGWSGLILASLCVSGVVLWWPRGNWKHALRIHWKTNWRGRIYELHRVGGFLLAGLLLISSVTGAALVWPDAATRIVGAPDKPKIKASAGALRSLDELVGIADAAFPDGRLTRIAFPKKAGDAVILRKKLDAELHPNGMNNIALDGASGRVLWTSDSRASGAGERAMNLRYPLHLGLAGGNVSRALAVLVGLSPLLLGVSGFLMWRARGRKRI